MFDMCTVLAKRAERQAEIKAKAAAIQARRTMVAGQRRDGAASGRDRRRWDEAESGAPAAGPGVRSLGALCRCSHHEA